MTRRKDRNVTPYAREARPRSERERAHVRLLPFPAQSSSASRSAGDTYYAGHGVGTRDEARRISIIL